MTPPVADLRRFLDGPEWEIRDQVRARLGEARFAPPIGCDAETHRRWVLDQLQVLIGAGLDRLSLPASCGGADDRAASLAAIETLGYGDLSLMVAFGVHAGLFTGAILGLGTADEHKRYLSDGGPSEPPGCFAMTETDHGSNIRDLQTVARYDTADDTFVLDTPHPGAAKDYIANALVARCAVVFARLIVDGDDRGLHPLVVELRDEDGRLLPGRQVEDCGAKAGLHGVGNGRIAFRQVRVPRHALLARFGAIDDHGRYASEFDSSGERFIAMLGTLLPARVGVAAAALSAAKSALTVAVRYGQRRRQFGLEGRPEQLLLDYVAHQRRLLPALAGAYAAHFAVRRAGDEALSAFEEGKTGDDRRRADALVGAVKAAGTWQAVATAQTCREACGGRGYLADMRLGAIRADVDVFTTFEGDNTVLLQLVARSLLIDLAAEAESVNPWDVVRHVAAPAAARARALAGRHRLPLDDPGFALQALQWRERHLLVELGRRIKRRNATGEQSDEAFLAEQDVAIDTATAYAERVMLESFCHGLEAAPGEWRPVLVALCRLHGLTRLEACAGWLVAHHYLGPATARSVRRAVNDLCRELRPWAGPLVEAFALPAVPDPVQASATDGP